MNRKPDRQSVRIAFVGLGRRGLATLRRHFIIDQAEIAVLCDLSSDALEQALSELPVCRPAPLCFNSWQTMLDSAPDVDLVYVSTDWASHAMIAIAAMKAGYDVAVEVPAVIDAESGAELVRTVETTGCFFTMVENCCYDPFHLSTTAVVKSGLLGEITHCEGAYIHDIRDELRSGSWQSEMTGANHANPYPTHGLGPVCQLLGVGSGYDRLDRVVSMSPSAPGLNSSLISTDKGRTILLQYDVATPRPYSRLQTVCGTSGYISKYPEPMVMLDGMSEPLTGDALECFLAGFRHPLLDAYESDGIRLGVDNMMNYIMDRRLIDLLLMGKEPDITVYDAVEWSSLSWLTRESLQSGSIAVAIPSFR